MERRTSDNGKVFSVLMYENWTRNYDPEIHEEYVIHDTPFPLPHHF